MITLTRELAKIIRQLLGQENIFGYQSIVANQLYLLYCFSGHIYFSKKIHKVVKYLWCGVITCQFIFAYSIGLDYLLHGSNDDLVMIFNVMNAIGAIQMATLGFSSILYLYSDRIEKMIKHVDIILDVRADSEGFKQRKIISDSKSQFGSFLTPYLICCVVYFCACILDMVLFFEENKAINYLYYPYPPPMVQTYGSNFGLIFAMQSLTSFMFMILIFESWSVFSLVLYWSVICSNEMISVQSYLQRKTRDFNKYIEGDQFVANWDEVFECALEHSVKEFQKATQLINYLRDFVEAIATIVIISTFCYGVALLYVCFASDLPLVLKLKCSTCYVDTGVAVLLFYWIGQNLNSSASEVSMAVYLTPWYQLVKIRQNVNVLLCQTQSVKHFAVFRAYRLLLSNFSRYLHGLVSCTNILLKLTNK